MSHSGSAYSTFRTPPTSKQQRPSFLHGNGGAANSHYGSGSNTVREGRRSEGVYAGSSHSHVDSNYVPSRFSNNGTVAYRRNHSIHSGGGSTGFSGTSSDSDTNSKLGNGYNTLPTSLFRGVRTHDPLNNVDRFKRRGESIDSAGYGSGSLSNFDVYRNQQGTPSVGGGHSHYNTMSYQQQPVGNRGKPPPENRPSLLLSPDENRFIFEILGRGRQTLSTAVGRLLTPTPDQQQWQVKDSTGAVCLVRDTTKKSYFIQVFSLRSKNMIFRQEIYNQFEYQMPQPTFMTFEGDHSMVAILFADATEASNFREALDGKLEAKRQRRNERETRKSRVLESSQVNNVPSSQSNHYSSNNNINTPTYPNANGHTVTTIHSFPTAPTGSAFNKLRAKTKGKDKGKNKTKLEKKDIGTPMDFRHVQHVGWDPNKGFDLNLEDKDLRIFFEKAGVSANELSDEKTRKFIYNFIEQHGGVDVVKRSANTNLPTRAPPPIPSSATNTGPPPVPTRTPSIPNSGYPGSTKPPPPPPPPSRPVPPPPPAATYPGGSAAVGPPPPPERTTSNSIQNSPTQYHHHPASSNGPSRPPLPRHISANGPSSVTSPAPPPPPPMPMGGGAPPPPPPPPPMSSPPREDLPANNGARTGGAPLPVVSDDRSQLMKQIQKGIQLKPVEVGAQPKRAVGISDCLSEIQRGVDLKKVPESAKAQPSLDAMDGLAGALARALHERQRALNPDSSSSDDDEAYEIDEEEWE